jgi:hypothetical protein
MMPQSSKGSRPGRVLRGVILAGLLACLAGCVTVVVTGLGPQTTPPSGFSLVNSDAPHAFRHAFAPEEPVRRGQRSERYELREGDCSGSDCGNFRARAEIVEDRDTSVALLNRDIWFGWSFYNASIRSVTRDTYLGTTIAQWRLAGNQPSLFRFIQLEQGAGDVASCDPRVCTRGSDPSWDVVVQLDELRQSLNWGAAQNDGNICRLFGMEANLGRWVDIVVNTNFGTDDTGYLRVWINGELRCDYRGPLVSAERALTQVPGPSHRRGIFNSFTQRWFQSQGNAPKPTLIAYVDEYRVGLSRTDVDPRVREVQRLPAVD